MLQARCRELLLQARCRGEAVPDVPVHVWILRSLLLHNHHLLLLLLHNEKRLCSSCDRARDLAGLHAAATAVAIRWTQHEEGAQRAHAGDVVRARERERVDQAAAVLLAQAASLAANEASRAADALVVAAVATAAAKLRADLQAATAEAEVAPHFATRLRLEAAALRLARAPLRTSPNSKRRCLARAHVANEGPGVTHDAAGSRVA